MNCMVLEWQDQIVLIDCGIQFPDARYPGVDLLAPDFSYLEDRWDDLRGIVVTHGHDDHIGAIPFILQRTDIDVYCTPFPRGLLENKLQESRAENEIRFHRIKPRKRFKVGPFEFDPIPVQHSIIESLAMAIDTPVGKIVHTGDFKHDPNEFGKDGDTFKIFEELGKQGVRLLLSDSTNAERTGHTLSEVDIEKSFETLLSNQKNRVIIALFASNIRRVERLLHLAHKQGKRVALAGRSMHTYTTLAHGQSSLNIPVDTLVPLTNIQNIPPHKLIILSTGSQAEPQSALIRMAIGTHKDVRIQPGDLVMLSSRFIPGNERAITAMIDNLYRAGADVLYESIHQIHVSGHGFQDELLLMLNSVKPQCFIPVHGEYRHLAKHALLAERSGVKRGNIRVIENGQIVELSKERLELGDRLTLQKTVIVENELMHRSAEIFSQRNNLAKTGIVFATFLIDGRSRRLLMEPCISTYGLLFREDEPDPNDVSISASHAMRKLYRAAGKEDDFVEIARLELRRFFKQRTSQKPIVIPLLFEL